MYKFLKLICILGNIILNKLNNKPSWTSKYNMPEIGAVNYGYHGKYSNEINKEKNNKGAKCKIFNSD